MKNKMDMKFWWIIPFIMIGVIVIFRRLKNIPADISNELLTIIVACLSIGVVISVLRFLPSLEK